MSDDEVTHLRERVSEFEDIILAARRVQHDDLPPDVAEHFLKHDPVLAWNLLELLDAYREGTTYPQDRLPSAMDHFIDTKLQLHYVTQVWPGTMNLMVYLRGFDPKNPLATPNLQLARLGYSQAMIGAERVLWERLMQSIYFLEKGSNPEGKHTQRAFFRELPKWSPRWDLLAEFQSEVSKFDESFRTPEYHKGSILKKELFGGDAVDMNEVLGLTTPIINGVWTILISNVIGSPHDIMRLGRKAR